MIIDFHTHAFPDALAPKAMGLLEKEGNIKGFLDGTVGALLASMDKAGIERSVICSIATKPTQFEPILAWSGMARSERIIPFPSIHPADDDALWRISRIRAEGFAGLKMHPFYQDFFLDEERMLPLYERIAREELLLVMHTGYDIAFPLIRRADPPKVRWVKERFPELKLVATHLGAWKQWDEVREHLIGMDLLIEISFALEYLSRDEARGFLLSHPADRLLFGSDSPWTDQAATVALLKGLDLGPELEERILRRNGLDLLGLAS